MDECEEWTYTERLDSERRLVVAQRLPTGTGRLVHFSIQIELLVDGQWRKVARIDTSDGEVHRHQFTRKGGDSRTVLEPIPPDHGEDVVDRWFDPALEMVKNEWGEYVRRWHRD